MRMENVWLERVDLVDHPASRHPWKVEKRTGKNSFAFFVPFRFEKSSGEGIISGVAYPANPNEPDSQGDFAFREDVAKMKQSWEEGGKRLGYMHQRELTDAEAVALDSGLRDDGSWVIRVRVMNDELIAKVRAGQLRGFSVQGKILAKSGDEQPTADPQEQGALASKANDAIFAAEDLIDAGEPEAAVALLQAGRKALELEEAPARAGCLRKANADDDEDWEFQVHQAIGLAALMLANDPSPDEIIAAIGLLETADGALDILDFRSR
jgi:hypothetical protein